MTSRSITTDVTTEADNTNAVELADNDFIYLAQGTTISASGVFGDGIHGTSGITTRISGDVFGRYHAIDCDGGGAYITINSTGSASGGFNDAINLGGLNNKIVNYGDINGPDGISFTGAGNAVTNYGHINGDDDAIELSGNTGDTNTIVNYGSIDGGTAAVYAQFAADKIINAGSITGDVLLSDGNDTFDGHLGTMFGKVDGGAGNDIIKGGASNDLILGGLGIDKLSGGAGDDTFQFADGGKYNNDTIADFQHGSDTIALDHTGTYFTKLAVGALDPTEFRVGSAAADANDHLIYNSAGQLLFDPDGNGAKAAFVIATLTGHPTLTAADILVV